MTPSTNNPKRGFIDQLLGFHIRIAQLALFAAFAKAVGDPAMTPLLAGALYLIAENPSANQSDLAALLVADPSTMVRLIDQLAKRGWVIRESAEHDRRHTVPRITAAGIAMLERMSPEIVASEADVAAALSVDERRMLLEVLNKMTAKRNADGSRAGKQ
jgi:DNA-binding MarR family transcriptional regulator